MDKFMFVFVVTFGVFVQALVGFGGTLLSMPLGIMLMGIGVAKPVTTILAWITGIVVLATEYKYINWRELLKMTAVMMIGVLGGIWVSGKIQLNFLLIIYGLVVAGIGIKKLFFASNKEAPKAVQNTALAVAGIMQGLFVSGGSFLAVYAVAQLREKHEFRATVNAVWAILNTVMIITFWANGALTREVLTMSGLSVIPTLAAIWLGGVLTKRVKQSTFLRIIYIILIISGAVLIITNI